MTVRSFKSSAIFFFRQSLNAPGGNILNAANAFGKRLRKRIRGDHAFYKPTRQFKPFLRRQLESHLANIRNSHIQRLHNHSFKATRLPN